MSMISYDDYREALRAKLIELKHAMPNLYSFQHLATACKVQKTYVSTVLGGNGHLNRDQLYVCCKFLGIIDADLELIEMLYELQRSDCQPRRLELTKRLETLRRQLGKTEQHIAVGKITTGNLELYYLNPLVPVVHVFITIPKFAKNPTAVANALGISKDRLDHILNTLVSMGVIAVTQSGFVCLQDTVHLPENSPFILAHRKLLRLAALERQEEIESGEGYGFSVVFSATKSARDEIQKHFLEFLKLTKSISENCKSEEVYQMNFDLIPWSYGVGKGK